MATLKVWSKGNKYRVGLTTNQFILDMKLRTDGGIHDEDPGQTVIGLLTYDQFDETIITGRIDIKPNVDLKNSLWMGLDENAVKQVLTWVGYNVIL